VQNCEASLLCSVCLITRKQFRFKLLPKTVRTHRDDPVKYSTVEYSYCTLLFAAMYDCRPNSVHVGLACGLVVCWLCLSNSFCMWLVVLYKWCVMPFLSWLQSLTVNLSWPSGRHELCSSLIVSNPRRLKGDKLPCNALCVE